MSSDKEAPKARAAQREPLAPKSWEMPDAFRQRLGDEAGRQRAMVADGHLLLVLHTPPKPGESERDARVFWRQPDGGWKPSGSHGETCVGELLGEYNKLLKEIESAETDANNAETYFNVLTQLNPLTRSIKNAYATLQTAREQMPQARDLILLRDRAYAVRRRAELLQESAKNTLDFVIARRVEEQAAEARQQTRAAHRLNVLAALFFPILTISSILSTGLDHGLGDLDKQYAPFPLRILLGVGLALGAGLMAITLRR